MNYIHYFKHAIPTDVAHAFGAFMLAVIGFLFPAPAVIYQAFIMLVMFDTLTGIAAAINRRTFNSRSWRTKLMPKVLTYLSIPSALWWFSAILADGPLEGVFKLASYFTLGSIGLIEVTSILENVSSVLGKRVTLRFSAKELKDLMEANHVNGDGGLPKSVPDGEHRPGDRLTDNNKS